MFNLKGRVAVISGASSGLGKQMAYAFAKQGADLVILARRIERLEELRIELEKEIPNAIYFMNKDKLIKPDSENDLALHDIIASRTWSG